MDSPNFGTWVNIEKREDVGRISPGDDDDSRPAITHDLLQDERNSGIRVRLVALGLEWRQRSVVIQQQYRLGCPGQFAETAGAGILLLASTRCSFLFLDR